MHTEILSLLLPHDTIIEFVARLIFNVNAVCQKQNFKKINEKKTDDLKNAARTSLDIDSTNKSRYTFSSILNV